MQCEVSFRFSCDNWYFCPYFFLASDQINNGYTTLFYRCYIWVLQNFGQWIFRRGIEFYRRILYCRVCVCVCARARVCVGGHWSFVSRHLVDHTGSGAVDGRLVKFHAPATSCSISVDPAPLRRQHRIYVIYCAAWRHVDRPTSLRMRRHRCRDVIVATRQRTKTRHDGWRSQQSLSRVCRNKFSTFCVHCYFRKGDGMFYPVVVCLSVC